MPPAVIQSHLLILSPSGGQRISSRSLRKKQHPAARPLSRLSPESVPSPERSHASHRVFPSSAISSPHNLEASSLSSSFALLCLSSKSSNWTFNRLNFLRVSVNPCNSSDGVKGLDDGGLANGDDANECVGSTRSVSPASYWLVSVNAVYDLDRISCEFERDRGADGAWIGWEEKARISQ